MYFLFVFLKYSTIFLTVYCGIGKSVLVLVLVLAVVLRECDPSVLIWWWLLLVDGGGDDEYGGGDDEYSGGGPCGRWW